MKLFQTEYFVVSEIDLLEIVKHTITGMVYIVALLKCGIWALIVIAIIKMTQIFASV